jgi:hypothetical protein
MPDYGKIAYEAYIAKTGGKSLVTGDTLPAWVDLRADIKEAWEAAAIAVTSAVVGRIPFAGA